MDNATLQQLTNDYGFDFVTFHNKLHTYPTKVNITNPYFINVPQEDRLELVEGLLVYVKFVYNKIKNDVNFNLPYSPEYLNNVNNARKSKMSVIGKAEDAMREAAFTLIEMKDAHNKPLNTIFFSAQFRPVVEHMINENYKNGKFDSVSRIYLPDVAERHSRSQSTFEHIVPFNVSLKLMLKFYHLSIQHNISFDQLKQDFINIILVLKQVTAITKLENDLLDVSHMPDEFWDNSHPLFMDPWARYRGTGIEIEEYNV